MLGSKQDDLSSAYDSSIINYIYDSWLRESLEALHLANLIPVQQAAIDAGLFYRQSFLVCAPSGSGKTLVGELAAMSAILDRFGKAANLVPCRVLAAQKAREFSKFYATFGGKAVLAIGEEEDPDDELAAADLLVTTFEKIDSVLRNAKTQTCVTQLSDVAVDEVHEIGEPNRGFPASVYGDLASIALRLGFPIIPTQNAVDTALLLFRIAVREQEDRKAPAEARHAPKKMSPEERQVYFLE